MEKETIGNELHLIKFTTEGKELKEYCFPVLPLTDFRDASLDHHIQLKMVEYMKQNIISEREIKYQYCDENGNPIMINETPLGHCNYKQNKR